MKLHPALLLACCVTAGAYTPVISTYDRHVIFDNSLSDDGYEMSQSYLVAPSTLETHEGKWPVETRHHVSPPNCLRLRWRSSPGGDWRMTVEITKRYARPFRFEGDALTFWVYPEFDLTEDTSPRVYLQDIDTFGTAATPLVKGPDRIPARTWHQVTLPFKDLKPATHNSTDDPKFRPEKAVSVSFMQGLDDTVERTVYVDDFQIRPVHDRDRDAPAAPAGVSAKPYERHIDISWNAVDAPDLLSYRIHRSVEGGDFKPVGTQHGTRTRFLDFLGEPGCQARYRVTAIDVMGNESVASAESESVQTRALDDEALMTMVQEACFRYYWETAHPKAGLAPEVLPGDPNLLALGGSGFGVMALIVGAERGFAPREAVAERMVRIVRFLAAADRFHGVWPHFLNGETGKAVPFFGKYDNGGDLVETAFMIQGLLAARQYFDGDSAAEKEIRNTVTRLWHEVEWDWYRKTPDSDVLYWHWSPDAGFHISHPLIGWNETMIVYLLAIASPTHPVPASLYHTGWAGTSERHVTYRRAWSRTTVGDRYVNGGTYYGQLLDVGVGNGSDLFFVHFSFMGFDPRGWRDAYTNYFENNRAIVRINHAYCVENPRGFQGYGPDSWGLSVGINSGGGKPLPRDDNGTISIMASQASMPYTPAESLRALRHFYRTLGPKVFGVYGFHDGFNATQNWYEETYMALNQAPITVMIENHRSGLVWRHFMKNPEIEPALRSIGFKRETQP